MVDTPDSASGQLDQMVADAQAASKARIEQRFNTIGAITEEKFRRLKEGRAVGDKTIAETDAAGGDGTFTMKLALERANPDKKDRGIG